jgi:cellulose synthase operon protein C
VGSVSAHTTVGDWLEAVEVLDHVPRTRRAVDLGRAAQSDPNARQIVEELRGSASTYAPSLALASAYGSRDGRLVVTFLSDRSRCLRARASKMLVHLGDDDACSGALGRLPTLRLKRVASSLRKARRFEPLDAFLVRAFGDPEASAGQLDCLGFGSSELVSRTIATPALERLSPAGWRRLAQFHPSAVLAELRRQLGAEQGIDPRLRWRLLAALPFLAKGAASETIELLTQLMVREQTPHYWLGPSIQQLARRFPCEVFDALRRLWSSARPVAPPGAFGAVRFSNLAPYLGAARLAFLIEHASATLSDELRHGKRWFLKLDAETRRRVLETWIDKSVHGWGGFLFRFLDPAHGERERVYRRWSAASRDQHGVIELARVAALPRDLREREARRHLESCDYLAARPRERTQYARFLRFAEARTVLGPWLGHPDGEERGAALRALIACAAAAREISVPASEHEDEDEDEDVTHVLELILARRFEQDPVRCQMLQALADLPRTCLREPHLPRLREITQHALDAADLSPATAVHLERLTVSLFRLDPEWASERLSTLLKVRGQVSTLGLVKDVPRAHLARLEPVLGALLHAWATQERSPALAWLAASIGPRLGEMPALRAAMQHVVRHVPLLGAASVLCHQLRRGEPRAFAALADELLASDRSFVAVPAILAHLASRRQSLLTSLLRREPMQGRFASSLTQWVFDFTSGHGCWSERQQDLHARAMARVLASEDRPVPALRAAIVQLSRLAYAPPDELLARAADPRQAVRELAVRALAHIDDGSGERVLLECLSDDRARWAIYAWRRALREKPRAQVVEDLSNVPLKQVTVAKEVLRLLGELGGEAGYRVLVGYDRRALHRDVRIALLRALWDHLERPEAWTIWEEAASDPDWVLASRLAEIPMLRLSGAAELKLCGLFARLLGRPELDARLSLLKRAPHLPLRDSQRALFRACLSRVASPTPDEAATALVACLWRLQLAEAPSLAAAVLAQCALPAPDAAPHETPRPTLASLLAVLASQLGPYAGGARTDVGRQVLAGISQDPWLVPEAIRLASRLLGFQDLAKLFLGLAQRSLLHFDSMRAALEAVEHSQHPTQLEALLRDSDAPPIRRLALEALACATRPKRGWSSDQLELLRRYRADPDPMVSARAHWLVPR